MNHINVNSSLVDVSNVVMKLRKKGESERKKMSMIDDIYSSAYFHHLYILLVFIYDD
jgi:hypothetical protein